MIFGREKVEAIDNTFDDELMVNAEFTQPGLNFNFSEVLQK